jgi:hypothetical protein
MADQGLINSRVFALDLRHSEDSEGALIYGGIDRSKYIGALETVDIIRGEGGEYRLATRLNSLGVTMGGRTRNIRVSRDDSNVMLDSGTTLTRMHMSVARPILQELNAQNDGEGFYKTDCRNRDIDATIDFGFGDKVIRVALTDFILELGPGTCYIGLVPTTDQQILGDSVLRAGYFVFDWDNEKIHLAQAANCGDDDIIAVGSGSDAVPSETGKCRSSDITATGRVSHKTPTYNTMILTSFHREVLLAQATHSPLDRIQPLTPSHHVPTLSVTAQQASSQHRPLVMSRLLPSPLVPVVTATATMTMPRGSLRPLAGFLL